MKTQEKAAELILRYMAILVKKDLAKKCALAAVNEILNNDVGYNAHDGVIGNDIWIDTEYWQEVKKEIEKL
jgi:hypothetical protein